MIHRIKQKLQYGTTAIEYTIVKSRRRKTSEVIVDHDIVEIRTPFDKPDHEINKLIQRKASWILKKQKEYRERAPEIMKPTFNENSTLPYLGKNYPLKILENQAKNSIRFENGQFIVTLLPSKSKNSSTATDTIIDKIYENWLMKMARPSFKNKVKSCSEKLGTSKPEKIIIKKLKNRWGSIGKKGVTINLNVNLLKAPVDVINYIILHELCHLKIKEHSYHFWDLLHKFMPNYNEKIDWLNDNGNNLVSML
jgi:predicted metal-dependent hydrolase